MTYIRLRRNCRLPYIAGCSASLPCVQGGRNPNSQLLWRLGMSLPMSNVTGDLGVSNSAWKSPLEVRNWSRIGAHYTAPETYRVSERNDNL